MLTEKTEAKKLLGEELNSVCPLDQFLPLLSTKFRGGRMGTFCFVFYLLLIPLASEPHLYTKIASILAV